MSKFNTKKTETRVAGGNGAIAATENNYSKLKRLVSIFMISDERTYKESGNDISYEIMKLAPTLTKSQFIKLVENTRLVYGLRHTPLLLIVGALSNENLRMIVSKINPKVLHRPTDAMDLIALYKTYNAGRTIPNQLKKLISNSLNNFDEYQFGKYSNTKNQTVSLKDVINLVHPKPKDDNQGKLFGQVLKGTVKTPMTWEVMLSNTTNKKEAWETLMNNKKLPALATIRNLKNILEAGVDENKLAKYINGLKSNWIFPFQIITAMNKIYSNPVLNALENYLVRMGTNNDKLYGKTYIILDISGSMGTFSSKNSGLLAQKAFSMAYSLSLVSDDYRLFLTSGSDYKMEHKTKEIKNIQNITDFYKKINDANIGYGGIFTAQAINWISKNYNEEVERVIVISDSQDCDRSGLKAKKIAKYMYVNNIAAYKNISFIDDNKPFDADITTFSSRITDFIKFHENED